LNTECIIDETLDGRRKVALTRKLDELIHHKWILEGLLMCLRHSRGVPLVHILDMVAMGAPLRSLAASVLTAIYDTALPDDAVPRAYEVKQELRSYVNGTHQKQEFFGFMPAKPPEVPSLQKYRVPSSEDLTTFLGSSEAADSLDESSVYGTQEPGNTFRRPNSLDISATADETAGDHNTVLKSEDCEPSPHAPGLGLEDILQLLKGPQFPDRRGHHSGMSFDPSPK
jgi:hypothetical protein